MSISTRTPSVWESAIQELKRLLDGLAATRSGNFRLAPVRTEGKVTDERNPQTAPFASQQPAAPQGSDSMPIVSAPPAAPTPPSATAPSATPAVVASAPTMFDARHISALLAALAGTGISGSSILKAVQEGINHTPSERWLPIAAVIIGLIVAFFAFKFLLQRIHRNHAGHAPDADFFGTWQRILTSRRTLGLIVTVAGTLVAGAGGTMIYQRSSQLAKAPVTTETSPVSDAQQPPTRTATDTPKVDNNTPYGIAGGGLVALLGGLWMVYRRTFPAPPKATSNEPADELPSEVSTPSVLPQPPPAQVSAPAQADAAINEPELGLFVPGDPATILLANGTTLTRVRDLFGLDSFSCNVLFLTAACEVDSGVAERCAKLQNGSPFPSASLAIALFLAPDAGVKADPTGTQHDVAAVSERAAKVARLAADAPLRAWRLIETFQPNGRNLLGATLKTDEPILHYLLGQPLRDERLDRFRAPLAPDAAAGPVAPSQWDFARKLAPRVFGGEFCELRGRDSVSKQLVALAAEGWRADEESSVTAAADAHARGKKMLDRVVCSSLPKDPADSLLFAMLWLRQTLLLGGALYLDVDDAEAPDQLATLRLFLRSLSTPPVFNTSASGAPHIFISTYEALPDLDAPYFSILVTKPEGSEQEKQWEDLVRKSDDAAQLADEFDFNLPTILRLHGTAASRKLGADISNIREVCRQSHQSRLDALAQRVIPVADWDALVLPEFQKNMLHALADQVRHRGRVYRKFQFDQTMNRGFGISALLTGESGTGKTTAAEVIAADIGCDLYRVDLSAVVDKFVGETEKKLRRVFDAAEEGGVALLFDEADAIFGRRSEVKDSHDRYANIQINYLLQRLENFSGLAILASNQANAIDQAFLRRLRFIVNFPMPDRELRRKLWQRAFPKQFIKDVPCVPAYGDALWDALAQTPLSGGQIHAIALNAAFLAARETPPRLTLEMIEHAMDAEFLKTGNPVRHAVFPGPIQPTVEAPVSEPPPEITQAAA